ncbi:MAG: hypothetical protein HC789_10030 [Microcoleus sp. CSU_2_2]|nr:hypothetical protein [Microcoleus sp. SU_5_3]NJS10690.1 hypothetical protein [Microcoleus sp. CSU_2_2]
MAITISGNSKIVTSDDRELDTVPSAVPKAPKKHRLVARWLTDENRKLYCQWMIED